VSDLDKPALRSTLVQLRRKVDAHWDGAARRSPDAFACRRGCDSCCHQRFSVFAIEADAIRDALTRIAAVEPALRARIREQADDPAHLHHCALLVDGACAVYGERPMICRVHGLPTLADGAVDHCPLNFTAAPPPAASVLRVDAVNQPLVVLATLWAGDRSNSRVELADLARGPDLSADGREEQP
jgi:hypothetical protein